MDGRVKPGHDAWKGCGKSQDGPALGDRPDARQALFSSYCIAIDVFR